MRIKDKNIKNEIIIKRNTIFTSELAAMNQGKDEAVATAFCDIYNWKSEKWGKGS